MKINSKLPDVGTTIFTVMSQLCVDHQAINLGQGFPDFSPDNKLIDYVTDAMKGEFNQYPPMTGIPALRTAIASKVKNLYGRTYDANTEITVTAGATEGLMASIQAFVHSGDEVIIIEPFYDLYIPAIKLAGGVPVVVPMRVPTEKNANYRVDWERVFNAVTNKTRMLILNFPHNPTGINLTDQDLDQLEDLVERTGIILLSDEVYEHIVFDGQQHQSLARRDSLAENAIIISSFGKTYHTTGWKVGYCCAPVALSAEIRKVHQFTVFTVTSPMQAGLAKYMLDPEPYMQLNSFYQPKRDHLFNGLKNTRFRPVHSEGTFFLLASYEEISDLPESEFAHWLTTTHGVGGIPVSAFYADPTADTANHKLIRFCFAKQDHTLDAALAKLAAI